MQSQEMASVSFFDFFFLVNCLCETEAVILTNLFIYTNSRLCAFVFLLFLFCIILLFQVNYILMLLVSKEQGL